MSVYYRIRPVKNVPVNHAKIESYPSYHLAIRRAAEKLYACRLAGYHAVFEIDRVHESEGSLFIQTIDRKEYKENGSE